MASLNKIEKERENELNLAFEKGRRYGLRQAKTCLDEALEMLKMVRKGLNE